MNVVKKEGSKKSHKVLLYTLSTCVWCKKTKQFLSENEVYYEYIDLDTASTEDKNEALKDLKKRKAPIAFPSIIIDEDKLITGYRVQELSEALEL
jgi:glutaredoxin-like protein NrdH